MYYSYYRDPTKCALTADCKITANDISIYEGLADGYSYLCTNENKQCGYFRDFILLTLLYHHSCMQEEQHDNTSRINEIIVSYFPCHLEPFWWC